MMVDQKKLAKAVAKASKNLVNYRKILLNVGEDEVAPAPFHYDWSRDLLKGKGNYAIQGFRESAKSQYILRSFPLYCLTFPSRDRDYIPIIKKNQTLASNKLKEIEREYETNPIIRGNLVKIHEQSGEVFSVDVKNAEGEVINVRFEAYGKGASIRGLVNQDRRPKIVIIDDPQDVEDSKSLTVQETDWNWFLSDVKFLGQKTRIFLIGNNLGERCIIERVFNNAKELKFKTSRVPSVTTTGESAWPTKFTLEDIAKEKTDFRKMGKIDIWLREKMCLATSEETRVFNKNDYRWFAPGVTNNIIRNCRVWATLDPAASEEIDACYRAICVNAVDHQHNWFIVDFPFGRWDSATLIDRIFDVVVKYRLKDFGIEKGMFEKVIKPFIYKEMAKRQTFFNIIELEHAKKGSKLERIKMLQPRFKAHTIWFPEDVDSGEDGSNWLAELLSELSGVTKYKIKSLYIDLVDAMAMQEQVAKAPFKHSAAGTGSLPRQAQDQIPQKELRQNSSQVRIRALPREAIH